MGENVCPDTALCVSTLHTVSEPCRYKYSFVLLCVTAWQHLAKTFLLREQIKASSKQACYCSAAWVPASKKQIDDYLAVAVNQKCKCSEKFSLCFFLLIFIFFMLNSGVSFHTKIHQGKGGKVEGVSIMGQSVGAGMVTSPKRT